MDEKFNVCFRRNSDHLCWQYRIGNYIKNELQHAHLLK